MASQDVVPEGRMTHDVAIGLLAFPDEMVRAVIQATGKREQRNRALPARLMVYLAMALWLTSASATCAFC